MTAQVVRFLYFFYHYLFQSVNRTCRYDPTCSQYALQATKKYGLIIGSWITFKRLIACHPFSKKPYYDPV
ncbi:hypothetical protein A2697_04840 [Candidatus Curtissbacteria bacterium RIFCSPHIGHO2_01_FULL_41_44]|uniref:Membrane protein insertion efficiency factor n=1 Tax=Candidatus Curtissbacteria bacterium RIFCSPLOWO2_01_FULL_42_50 TaxID=1797730 RepID=A0A1F5H677_9BACT|nr:MAG: hypothetical protein A3C33_00290 [Candidatus Curtissbacteria bacterium RIFCSPHIGHO2_02_FULL_42_58]OGD93970.1 MAG: hypothetical protein A2697_04840 [Candidatus Curtissbacteria bacterium RIFCSPHIGHO2_01_FULL_41_44]OGD97576.1 MAG: hypothetical protein A3E71_05145 [Candidatus Curtissbacteria bacterium RIFCSPHIGHO2_12_FULL_42_33]OGD99568.1 MAG: hypothetical protein A3B54_02350 [Candidatus Curtissbacteria bacterium RIFCSPLOWO2_01_FULL_42_50]OGE02548.1 MAG: hypothetical protein A3G16_03400 [Ca